MRDKPPCKLPGPRHRVIATASPGKWAALRQQGIAHVLNSRTLAFADEVMALTGGAGVAVVLNSLNGDFIERSFAALGHGGRFVEIGKLEFGPLRRWRPSARTPTIIPLIWAKC